MFLHFGGSRSLSPSFFPFALSVARFALSRGFSLRVGCAVGADALFLRSLPVSSVSCFSAFASSGAGSFSGSAVSVVQSFASRGGSVSWLAGGPLRLPLRARLIRRSLAALSGCRASVLFLSGSGAGSGSLAVGARAVLGGGACFVFVCSPVPVVPAPLPGCVGRWVRSSLWGVFPCWSWAA